MFSCLHLYFFLSTLILVPPHMPFLLLCVVLSSGHPVTSSYSGNPETIIFPLAMFCLLLFILKTFTSPLSPPFHLCCISSSWSSCSMLSGVPLLTPFFDALSLSLPTSNLVYTLWPDGSYWSLQVTTTQCLPVASRIQIPYPGILGLPRAGPNLHFRLCFPLHPLLSHWTTP